MDRLDTNIAVLLRDDLDGTVSLAMFRQPVVVMAGGKETMQGPHVRAAVRGPPVAIFTSELLTTGNDSDNRAAVQAVSRADLDLVGIAVYARRNVVDKVLNGAVGYEAPHLILVRRARFVERHAAERRVVDLGRD